MAAQKKDHRVEMSVEGLKDDFAWHLRYTLAKAEGSATERDHYTAFANAAETHGAGDDMDQRFVDATAAERDGVMQFFDVGGRNEQNGLRRFQVAARTTCLLKICLDAVG